jgi:CxxC motif-containing protein (DUF1111 family)
MFTRTLKILLAATAIGAVGCGQGGDEVASSEGAVLGDAIPGTNGAAFAAARDNFNLTETVQDGAGPIFNERSCSACHSNGTIGGAGQNIERRYGRVVNGVFDALESTGGSLRQLFGLGGFNPSPGVNCNSGVDTLPATATIRDSGRLTTPLFGLGLVDSLPDSRFDALAAREPAAIRGIVNRVSIVMANPLDAGQRNGATRVGRFGWKSGVSNLGQFAADAYLNEMGITTQHCFKGTSILTFATESKPNGVAQPSGCDDRGAGGAGIPAGTDDGVGSCAGGLTEIQDDVELFTDFMTFLAPPPVDSTIDPNVARQGALVFLNAGCAGCHFPGPLTTPNSAPNGVPGGMAFFPFSDFALHDMGALGDMIGNDGDTVARTRMMRTAPLWGLRFRTRFLHDGRAASVTAAIQAHAGQGAAAATAFNALGASDRSALLRSLNAI